MLEASIIAEIQLSGRNYQKGGEAWFDVGSHLGVGVCDVYSPSFYISLFIVHNIVATDVVKYP